MTCTLSPVGVIHSPYKEKFAIPRQPNLVSAGQGELHLIAPYNNPDAVRGLEQFSHLWLLFIFHQTEKQGWRPTVRPPRLGGNERMGVFATRSTFRPNPIGLSAVELKSICVENKQVILKLGSVDLVDGTPIVDIKPYIPYSDSYPEAIAGFAQQKPLQLLGVEFSPIAINKLAHIMLKYPSIKLLIEDVISQDPRPAYHASYPQDREYGLSLYEYNVKFKVVGNQAIVLDITS